MIHVAKKHNLPQSPFSIDYVIECVTDLLDCNFLLCIWINRRTENWKESQILITTRVSKFIESKQRTRREVENWPDEAISASSDRANGRGVLGGNLEDVAVDIVLRVSTTVNQNRLHWLILFAFASHGGSINASTDLIANFKPFYVFISIFFPRRGVPCSATLWFLYPALSPFQFLILFSF